MTDRNSLYYGDNLDVLRRYIKDETIDLVYLDPPFNSNQDYNVLFGERNGHRAAAQIRAFEDTWTWDETASRAYEEIVEAGGRVSETMQAFRRLLGESDMLAYLAMMAPRLVELRRVLKATGSLYLHCDSTASAYLKILMDGIFGPRFYRNEIVWRRITSHADAQRFGMVHDTIHFFAKTADHVWNTQFRPYTTEYEEKYFRFTEPDGRRYWKEDATGAGQGPPRRFGDRMIDPPAGRHWRWTQEGVDKHWKNGRFVLTRSGKPEFKRYLDEQEGEPVGDWWDDIKRINMMATERLGYPTQKPQALLERIIKASSNEGDTVLDPFCGCGTTVAAAQALKRRWIGIDITHLAIGLIKKRLLDSYGEEIAGTYRVIGEPVSVPDAERLAAEDPYQFQWWALGLVGARPTEQKKGADKGIDGRLFFHDDKTRETKQIIFSVKAGELHATYVRDLRGVVEREKAAIGVMISFQEPTKPMRTEAASAGFYSSNWGDHPRIQLRTVAELLAGKRIDYPPTKADATFKKAPRVTYDEPTNQELPLDMVAERPGPPPPIHRRRKGSK